jgi:energy-converting hydrogenase A subunit M
METSMQKLKRISEDLHYKYHEDITLKWLIDNIDDFIKEEKEQIADAFNKGYIACDLDEALEINRTKFNGDDYYNKQYQNK